MYTHFLQTFSALSLSLGLVAPAVPPVFPPVLPSLPKASSPLPSPPLRDWNDCVQMAQQAYLRGDAAACERYFKAALVAAKGHRERTIETLDALDQLYDALADEQNQKRNLLQLLEVLQSGGRADQRLAEAYSELSALSIFDNKSVAEDYVLKALEQYRRLGDRRSFDYAVTLNNLAWIEAALAKRSQAERHYLRSISLLDHEPETSRLVAGMVSNNLAELYVDMGKPRQAEKSYYKAIKALVAASGPNNALVHSIWLRYQRVGGTRPIPGR